MNCRYLQMNWRYLQIGLFGDICNSITDIFNSIGDISNSIADMCTSIGDIFNSVNKCENGAPYICCSLHLLYSCQMVKWRRKCLVLTLRWSNDGDCDLRGRRFLRDEKDGDSVQKTESCRVCSSYDYHPLSQKLDPRLRLWKKVVM